MTKLTEYTSYADAQRYCTSDKLWELFDGDRDRLNIAHECIDRHVSEGRVAVILAHADGRDELITFEQIARESAQFANYLAAQGIKPGDRVAVMLEPSHAFYVAMFGAIKYGAIAVPLFTLFGPDGIRLAGAGLRAAAASHECGESTIGAGPGNREGHRRRRRIPRGSGRI